MRVYGKRQVWRPSSGPVYLKSLINLFEIILQIRRIFETKKEIKLPPLLNSM